MECRPYFVNWLQRILSGIYFPTSPDKRVLLGKSIWKFFDYIVDRASYILLGFSGVLIVLMAWVITYGALRRYLFASPEPYSYEISCTLLLACVAFAFAGGQNRGQNIKMDIFVVRLSPQKQLILRIFSSVLGLIFCAVLLWESWGGAWYVLQIGRVSDSVLRVPLFPVMVTVPIGAFLLFLVLIAQIHRYFVSLKTKPETENAGKDNVRSSQGS
jgi:C4-dicarboxylate transporter, DctQ subunit